MLQTNVNVGLPRFTLMRIGVGVYRGESCKVMVKPGWPNRGLVYYRKDTLGGLAIPARPRFISSTSPTLQLAHGSADVAGVDVFMAAVFMAGNWDLDVHVGGPEMPALDGSALPWVKALKKADLFRTGAPKVAVALRKKIELKGSDWSAVLEPADIPSLVMTMKLDRPGVGDQEIKLELNQDSLVQELAPARVFGFHIQDVEVIEKDDEFLLEEEAKTRKVVDGNAVPIQVDDRRSLVFDRTGSVENEGGLRFPDEPVRHRALGLVGALSLLGAPLLARITCHNTQHTAHKHILRALENDGDLEMVPSR